MAHPYPPPQASLTGYLSGPMQHMQEPPLSAYSVLGTGQYPESVALWHNPPAQPPQPGLPIATSYPPAPKPPSLLQPLPDQKKHKRTRSGCFTCRSRRIKCDEARPVCDRCRKGNRDCVYPSASAGSASKAGSRSGVKPKAPRPQSQGSDSSGLVEQEEVRALEPILDEEEEDEDEEEGSVGSSVRLSPGTGPSPAAARSKQALPKKQSAQSLGRRPAKQRVATATTEGPVFGKDASSSPSTEASSRFESISVRSASIGLAAYESPVVLPSTAHLAEDLRFYLSFHQECMSYRHYFLRPPSDRFVHQSIVEYALRYEPLLYAVVGFAAYHHCVQTGRGKLYTFLKYYNKALTLLRKSLGSGEPHCEATLITVLVLTTFEEFIGDWVNLIDHHQAAHALMQELLTPESACTNPLHHHIFLWYARFDVVAGIVAGNETVLGREWYIAKEEYDAEQAAMHPDDAGKQLALAASINRRFGLEMASLYAKLSRGMIPFDQFVAQNDQLELNLDRIKQILDQYNNSEFAVWDYPNKRPLTDEDIVDPYIPGRLHQGPLWDINIAWIDYYSTKAMFKYQSLLSVKKSSWEELGSLAIEQCRLIEAIERWPEKESGYIFAFKNSLGMASLFSPKDDKHVMWSRRKFALMEQNGYVTPPKFRQALAAVWQLPELNHWWLPHDEGYPNILREVRAMTEERTNNPRDNFRESVRDLKTLFWNISLDDTESENSPVSTGPEGR
ncbi:putative Zn(II)2Cys6 transcription factor [Aspergillus steynii IBT 23096]|uniref:Putative Zn(II)2Cys6 transcription factor n=1 Tax=Aspergillus steynii IBT 23096 TaxID=1392250 RepID=A0A2I2G552_9EURO|nr:putative Zn(II)2Cys6 transcription factor [Aspergillus steynii IBT 23096]PLB48007.1 putative Zn(II)2Cys6 transcription factor [Aspergillus steynii IBT 23096]